MLEHVHLWHVTSCHVGGAALSLSLLRYEVVTRSPKKHMYVVHERHGACVPTARQVRIRITAAWSMFMRADSTAGPSQKELGLVARLTLHHRPSLRASLP
jgi:hypothetical protein